MARRGVAGRHQGSVSTAAVAPDELETIGFAAITGTGDRSADIGGKRQGRLGWDGDASERRERGDGLDYAADGAFVTHATGLG